MTDPTQAEVPAGDRKRLPDYEQMIDAQAGCVPCRLCGGSAVISDAGPGYGYYIRCGNSVTFRESRGCLIKDCRLGGWAYNVMDWWNRLHATPSTSVQGAGEATWLIRRGGAFFRPDAAGYTTHVAAAGLYTREEADRYADVEGVTIHSVEEYRAEAERTIAGPQRFLAALSTPPAPASVADEARARLQAAWDSYGDGTAEFLPPIIFTDQEAAHLALAFAARPAGEVVTDTQRQFVIDALRFDSSPEVREDAIAIVRRAALTEGTPS